MFVSFIIPAYNEEALIGATVDAIRRAIDGCADRLDETEIIVVNDASADATAEVARRHGARVIDVEKRQIAAVRNAGAAHADGDVFIFVDADTLISPQVLSITIDQLNRGVVGGGAAVKFDGGVSLFTRVFMRVLVEAFVVTRMAAGCFVYCRRDAFEKAGGFNEKFFASEEIWISKALGAQGRFVVLRQPVTTSARKVRMYGVANLLLFSFRMMFKGLGAVQKREGLDIWYDGRRE